MRAFARPVALLLAFLVTLQLVFFGLLVAGSAVPDRPVVQNLARDVAGGHYGPDGLPDGMGGRSSSYTECVVVGTGLSNPEYSAVDRAVRMPRIKSCKVGAEQIRALAAGEDVNDGNEYFRYWAGYVALTRPVLALSGMEALRVLVGGMFAVSLVGLVLVASRVAGARYALALTTPMLVASNMTSLPATSFSQALCLAVAFGGVVLAAWTELRASRWLAYAVALGAASYNFFDLLTTPAIPWSLTAALVGAVAYTRSGSARTAFGRILLAGVVWPVAFAFTWVSRWVIAAIFLGGDYVADNVLSISKFRINGAYESVDQTPGAGVVVNVAEWLSTPATAWPTLVIGLTVAVGALVLAGRRHGAAGLRAAGVLSLPALVVPFWLAALNNHSQIHAFFVYRTVPVALGVVVAACVLAAARRPRTHVDPVVSAEALQPHEQPQGRPMR